MLNARPVVAAGLLAATIALMGCPNGNPAQNDNPITGTTGGTPYTITAPFDDIAKGAASLQQAAGMAEGAKSPALTTVAPLQQTAGYRVSALQEVTPPADDSEVEGLFTTFFDYTFAQRGTVDGVYYYGTHASYQTYDEYDQNVESGTNIRVLGYQKTTDDAGKDIVAVAVSEERKATSSKRRKPGTYRMTGVVAVHEQADFLQLAASFEPLSGGASSSIDVKYMKRFEEPTGGWDFDSRLANRGAQISEEVSLKGRLASGESLDVEARKAGTDTAPTRAATASVDLGGGKGKIAFSSDLTLTRTSAFPSAIAGTVTVARKDQTNASHGQFYINSFTPQSSTKTIETAGELRNSQGTKVGTFTGTIDVKAGQWTGIYQQTGQATKSIDLSGLLSQIW